MSRLRSQLFGLRGMVVSGHPLASLAGWNALEQGGSAADAAVAAAAVLAVTLPQACTIGGDAFILAYQADTLSVAGLNGSGPAPAAVQPSLFSVGIPETGALASTIPGAVSGWHELHGRLGRLGWDRVLAAAVDAAEQGFAVSAGLGEAIEHNAALLRKDPYLEALFTPAGGPLQAGQILKQPRLAATIRQIAADGVDAFYGGGIAAALSRLSKSRGGLFTEADFAGYQAEWVEPLTANYRGLQIAAIPPNSYGLLFLMQLNVLQGMDISGQHPFSARRYAMLMAAADEVFSEGRRWIADPEGVSLPMQEMLSAETAARLRRQAELPRAPDPVANRGGTALVSAADSEGNGVILIQSVFHLFGSGVADAETGILLNNRMTGFTTEAGHPNQVAGGRRPAHTLCPSMALHEGRLRFILGTPGGPGQTLTLAQILSHVVDHGLSLADAVSAPRWSIDFSGQPLIEADAGADLIEDLNRLGRPVRSAPSSSPFFGSAEMIEIRLDGTLSGVADGRRDACALGA